MLLPSGQLASWPNWDRDDGLSRSLFFTSGPQGTKESLFLENSLFVKSNYSTIFWNKVKN